MAHWFILPKENGSRLKLVYRSSYSPSEHICGYLRGDTDVRLIVDWIVEKGDAGPGDLIVLPDRTVLQFSLSTAEA